MKLLLISILFCKNSALESIISFEKASQVNTLQNKPWISLITFGTVILYLTPPPKLCPINWSLTEKVFCDPFTSLTFCMAYFLYSGPCRSIGRAFGCQSTLAGPWFNLQSERIMGSWQACQLQKNCIREFTKRQKFISPSAISYYFKRSQVRCLLEGCWGESTEFLKNNTRESINLDYFVII